MQCSLNHITIDYVYDLEKFNKTVQYNKPYFCGFNEIQIYNQYRTRYPV